MHAQSVVVYDRFLGALANLLTKASDHCAAQKVTADALLTFRLFPDMFPLTTQVQLACDFAARASARLAGAEPQSFADTETTFEELQARIAAARAYMASFDPALFDGAATRMVTVKNRRGEMTMTGQEYLNIYSAPQFFFHVTTAYNILRHNGVAVGKMDYMGVVQA